jgi:hypothetical protein
MIQNLLNVESFLKLFVSRAPIFFTIRDTAF